MIRRLLATTIPLLALALPALGQSVPAANYTDMWWNPSESGWGISFAQHAGSDGITTYPAAQIPRSAGGLAVSGPIVVRGWDRGMAEMREMPGFSGEPCGVRGIRRCYERQRPT